MPPHNGMPWDSFAQLFPGDILITVQSAYMVHLLVNSSYAAQSRLLIEMTGWQGFHGALLCFCSFLSSRHLLRVRYDCSPSVRHRPDFRHGWLDRFHYRHHHLGCLHRVSASARQLLWHYSLLFAFFQAVKPHLHNTLASRRLERARKQRTRNPHTLPSVTLAPLAGCWLWIVTPCDLFLRSNSCDPTASSPGPRRQLLSTMSLVSHFAIYVVFVLIPTLRVSPNIWLRSRKLAKEPSVPMGCPLLICLG